MILKILKILIINIMAMNNCRETPVRLGKNQQKKKFTLTQQDIEIICIILFGIIVLTCIFLILFTTSCTDSGLIYNGELA